MNAARPAPVPDTGTGPPPAGGRVDDLFPGLVRVTAPNPGVMTGPGTNTYLVGGSGAGGVAVIDPGPDLPDHRDAILRAAAERHRRIAWILVTHTHPDHAPGAGSLSRVTGAPTVGFGSRDDFVADRTAGGGSTVATPSWRLTAVHTPGHATNHLCWLWEDTGVLFSGDHVMHGSTVVIRPPDGDMADYLTSLRRLVALDPPLVAIAPGHGRLIETPAVVVEGIVHHRLDREAGVARALADAGTATVDELVGAVYADVAPALLPVARYSLWAHLEKLEAEGRAKALPPEVGAPSPAPLLDAPVESAAAAGLLPPRPGEERLAWRWRTA